MWPLSFLCSFIPESSESSKQVCPGESGKRGIMNFNVFVETIVQQLQKRMGEVYEIRVTEVTKNNDIRLTGIIMLKRSDRISPTIYLEEPYRRFRGGAGIEAIVDDIVMLYEAQVRDVDLDMQFFCEYECVKDRIFHKLINYEKNRKLLEDVPHFRWCDLAIVFYYLMKEKTLGNATILIHENHSKMWGQSASDLYRTAQHNMKRRMPDLMVPMEKLVGELTGIQIEDMPETDLYVLTNKEKFYGASAMLYSDQMRVLADRLQSDLLILPSSVHEVLLLPDDTGKDYSFYRKMVAEVNETQVEPEEILSGSLYRYERKKAEIKEIYV